VIFYGTNLAGLSPRISPKCHGHKNVSFYSRPFIVQFLSLLSGWLSSRSVSLISGILYGLNLARVSLRIFVREHGVFILSSANFSRTFRQITQQQNTIQIWDSVKLFICVSFITLQILGFFHRLVLILIFYGVTVKTKNKAFKANKAPLFHISWQARVGISSQNSLERADALI